MDIYIKTTIDKFGTTFYQIKLDGIWIPSMLSRIELENLSSSMDMAMKDGDALVRRLKSE